MTQKIPDPASIYHGLELASPEQEIRLLQVSQGLSDGLLDCRLSRHDLRNARFVVLSYQWGYQDATRTILLNGTPFMIRDNLFEFLCVIREQRDMYLWIDALCINQTNTEERNRQVKIMGSIFYSASMVLSWLGSSDAVIEQAFDLMSRVWNMGSQFSGIDDELLPCSGEESQEVLWRSVLDLCHLSYWHRVWVVQEVLLSSNNYLMCGNRTLTWQEFANFMSLISLNIRFRCPPHIYKAITTSTASSYAASKPYVMVPRKMQWAIGEHLVHDYGKSWQVEQYNLFRILAMFGERDCTDTLDHIYALLSLTAEGIHFPVRYGVSPLELMLTVFHFCGQSSAARALSIMDSYKPVSQRALVRNARFLAEILQITPVLVRPTAYFHGVGPGGRDPNMQAEPHFPCSHQLLILDCTLIVPGEEPPVLQSRTLRRTLATIDFERIFHVNESLSWLLCSLSPTLTTATVAGIITIKESQAGRGFRILEPGTLSCSNLQCSVDTANGTSWTMHVPPTAHMDFLKTVILGVQ